MVIITNKKSDKNPKPLLRMTRQRRVILEELKKVYTHPTADVVYQMVRRRLPAISLGTVYRNLEILSKNGMIQKLELGGIRRRYDGNTEMHHHIRCARCDKVEDLPTGFSPIAKGDLCENSGYEILDYRFELIGLCPKCRQSER